LGCHAEGMHTSLPRPPPKATIAIFGCMYVLSFGGVHWHEYSSVIQPRKRLPSASATGSIRTARTTFSSILTRARHHCRRALEGRAAEGRPPLRVSPDARLAAMARFPLVQDRELRGAAEPQRGLPDPLRRAESPVHLIVIEVAAAAAYLIFSLAYRSRRHSVRIAVGIIAAAALFEVGQFVSPGRTPALSDWVASSRGVAGMLIGLLVARLLSSRDA
jgi:VanZ family protein